MQLSHLPLRPSTLQLLRQRGFASVRELRDARKGGLAGLAAELQVPPAAAAELVREVEGCLRETSSASSEAPTSSSAQIGVSAAELLRQQQAQPGGAIVSFCRAVDQMLHGGVGLGELTELSGLPGAGKTQWAMQLAVDASLPVEFGGVAGEALYIDTEGSFAPDRCYAMASSLVKHIQHGIRRRKQTQQPRESDQQSLTVPDDFTPENILSGIHVFRVHDEAAQTALIYSLPHFIRQHQTETTDDNRGLRRPIKLIVIDSMAFHYRASGPDTDFMARTQSLMRQASLLAGLASQYQLAVVAVNQMTTKVGGASMDPSRGADDTARCVPALGESWAHAVSTRLLLRGSGSSPRECRILKSPRLPEAAAAFQIVEGGVRGLEYGDRGRGEPDSGKRSRLGVP